MTDREVLHALARTYRGRPRGRILAELAAADGDISADVFTDDVHRPARSRRRYTGLYLTAAEREQVADLAGRGEDPA